MNFNDFLRPELLILVPCLWFIGWAIKCSAIKDCAISFILAAISFVLCLVYTFASQQIVGISSVLMCIYISATQGIIATACAVFGNQLIKQGLELLNKRDK